MSKAIFPGSKSQYRFVNSCVPSIPSLGPQRERHSLPGSFLHRWRMWPSSPRLPSFETDPFRVLGLVPFLSFGNPVVVTVYTRTSSGPEVKILKFNVLYLASSHRAVSTPVRVLRWFRHLRDTPIRCQAFPFASSNITKTPAVGGFSFSQ